MGGLFGVGVFFVLSGFLITTILQSEYEERGRIQVGEFLRRRAWRLLPALLAFLAVMIIATAVFGRDGWFTSNPFRAPRPGGPLSVVSTLKGSLAAITYTYNFLLAYHHSAPAPFGHLWTLAVEGQFYLWWAFAMSWLLRRGRAVLAAVTVALIAVSALSPLLAWRHGAGADWIYFATLPQVQFLLAGALLAQARAAARLGQVPAWVLRVGAAAGGGVLLWMVFRVANVTFKYLGGPTVVAVGASLVVAYLIDDRGYGAGRRVLATKPLLRLGERSYAVYLWHWPLAEWTNELPHAVGVPLALGCTLILAELSWRLVEMPAQRLARHWVDRIPEASDVEPKLPAASRA